MGLLDTLSDAYSGLLGGVNNFYQNDGLAGLLGMTSVNRQIHDATQAQMNAPTVRAGVAAAVDNPMTMAVGPATIRAYHGSPYSFDKFDLSKIGTGEGAQAYGHGLYFADNEAVAKSYREGLAGKPVPKMLTLDGKPMTWGDTPADRAGMAELHARTSLYNVASPEDATRILGRTQGELERTISNMEAAHAQGRTLSSDRSLAWEGRDLSNYRDALRLLNDGRVGINPPETPGSMYEVNLHADPAALLDWDKPLVQQPRALDMMTNRFGIDPLTGEYRNSTGQIHDVPRSGGEAYKAAVEGGDPSEISRILNQSGIPGIKYLDGGSRGAGTGTSNYVMFDPNLVEILRKYGLAGGLLGGSQAAGLLGSDQ